MIYFSYKFKPIEFDRFKEELGNFASVEERIVLVNFEDMNADLISQEVPKLDKMEDLGRKPI